MRNYILLIVFSFLSLFLMAQEPAMKVSALGNIGIGTGSPNFKMDLMTSDSYMSSFESSNVSFARVIVNSQSATNSGFDFRTGGIRRWSTAAYQAGAGNIDYTFWNDQTNAPAILIDGDTNNTNFGGTVSSMGTLLTSDERMKTSVKSFKGGLAEVLRINPVKFKYKNTKINSNVSDRQFIGVIAQELKKVDPTLVSDYTHHVTDENLNPTGEKVEYLQIQSDAVQYLLVNAVKEQQEMIENLKSQIREIKDIIEDQGALNNIDKVILSETSPNALSQNSPNPYEEMTSIDYVVSEDAISAKMVFYNLQGQMIKSIQLQNGSGTISVSAEELPSGTYTYSLEVDGKVVSSKKMVKMR